MRSAELLYESSRSSVQPGCKLAVPRQFSQK
jgi:hypothetical protein